MLIVRFIALVVTAFTFFYYILGLMHLSSLLISGALFFLSLLVTIRLFTPSGKKPTKSTQI